jgi:hypothetical protein
MTKFPSNNWQTHYNWFITAFKQPIPSIPTSKCDSPQVNLLHESDADEFDTFFNDDDLALIEVQEDSNLNYQESQGLERVYDVMPMANLSYKIFSLVNSE